MTIKLLLAMMLLTACSMTKSNVAKIKLPEMPIAGSNVGKEIVAVCDETKCKNIYEWIVKLHEFRVEYNVYRNELLK